MTRWIPLLAVFIYLLATPAYADGRGFIHGTLILQDGSELVGFIRWEREEAFWDDLFHSYVDESPWFEYVDQDELLKERKREYFATHGLVDRLMWTLHSSDDVNSSRVFICRFGDLESLARLEDDDWVTAVTTDGQTYQVSGYSNDVNATLIVENGTDEPIEVEWEDMAEIRFSQAPEGSAPPARRLHGRVQSSRGVFEGFIQWDSSECTTADILDGRKEEVPMGDIRSITRLREGGSRVEGFDGQVQELHGTNDVDDGNRGVIVETRDQGRVNVDWKRFDTVVFDRDHGSGPGRADFPAARALKGRVTDRDGGVHEGRIVYDLDEAWTRDLFNGYWTDLEYAVPFSQIVRIVQESPEICLLTLRSEKEIRLQDSQDTGDRHAGVLVFPEGSDTPTFLPWSGVETVEFDQ